MTFDLLVTGATAELSADRAKHIIQGVTKRGAMAYLRTRPVPVGLRHFKQTHSILWSLALYGAHYSSGDISAEAMRKRIDYSHTYTHQQLTTSCKAGYLRNIGELPRVGSGRLQPMYTLTPSGIEHAQGWVTNMLNGHLVAVDARGGQATTYLRQRLGRLPGVVIADSSARSIAVPYNTPTLVLALCWVYQQAGQNIGTVTIGKLLDMELGNAAKPLRQLVASRWSTSGIGSGTNARYYQLTDQGEKLAYNYIRTLLL